MRAWVKFLPVAMLVVTSTAACTGVSVRSATPKEINVPSPPVPVAADATPVVCHDARGDTYGRPDLTAVTVAVNDGTLDLTAEWRNPVPRSYPLENWLTLANANDAYQLRFTFTRTNVTQFYVYHHHMPGRTLNLDGLHGQATISRSGLSVSVPMSSFPNLSPDSFNWSFNTGQLGNDGDFCPSVDLDNGQVVLMRYPAPDASASEATMTEDLPLRMVGQRTRGLDTATIRTSADWAGFDSPSGNIFCSMSDYGVRCGINDHTWPLPPRPADCNWDWGDDVSVDLSGASVGICASDAAGGGNKLPYGHGIDYAEYRCVSEIDGVRCQNRITGNGFFLSREQALTY